jgi:hypothetical protein|tara:strand:- start:923 stop:1213 length:291 start_codon:yes stop_codon:yes gene_type:complete
MSLDAINLVKEVETPGIQEFQEPTGKIAYGFLYNRLTGSLDVLRHEDGSMVKMEDNINNIINDDDYTTIVWSNKLLNFSWAAPSTNYPGHLQVEIV